VSKLLLFKTLWGFSGSLAQAQNLAAAQGFDGLELNLHHPCLAALAAQQVQEALSQAQQRLIVEIVTGGDYVPALAQGPAQQLQELREQMQRALELQPVRISVIAGSDAWGPRQQREFWDEAVAMAKAAAAPVCFETHRSRSLFNPWTIEDWLHSYPDLRLTADLSHWCAVAERLMTPELTPIQAMADRVDHIHARVGHAQGPSVGHPFAPEWTEALEAHRRCWALFSASQRGRGLAPRTITPEFGPDGYLPQLPFTAQPVADLEEINRSLGVWIKAGALER
jgi:sugar phosphate isomerase/epimerase